MKNNRCVQIVALICVVITGLFIGCSLDVTNPNNASEEQVLTTSEGIVSLAVGMQQFYATTALEAYILYPGVTSREVAINTTFANLVDLEAGGPGLPNTNANVAAIWSRSFRVISMAEDLLNNVNNVRLAEGTRSGIIALAHLYKAMALGFLAQSFEQAPVTVDKTGKASFVPRQQVFETAIDELEAALQTITSTPPSDEFNSKILSSGFDLLNTINAYRARYNLLAGRYQEAINAANAVDPSATSVFTYDDQNQNPIYQDIIIDEDYAPRDNFGLQQIEANDGRLAFYLIPSDKLSDPNGFPIEDVGGFFTTPSSAIPAYVPGEMALIRAEAHLRLGEIDAAIQEINAIRTKTPDQDPFGIGAGLEPYSGPNTTEAVRDEIFRQRSAELFMSGMRLEDSRRLEQPGPTTGDPFQRNRNFYPYPVQERNNNPNTPEDPAI
ncbi:MAG: RagB/SusD family nutrient uptake outer membrane protein [Calditrichaeota bacterium]|nr:MAG: RagB/SusD family nutrient uptake outer membrane protein [Calditrichota bacterium]